ncbi:related to TAF1-TFIID subunit (TBP-associated factor), 145 kD [Sporisorium reilianum f. sp. reilianum]|uniref:Related to TAF1-TFIID subunit (TBP-associated factor), 145 kD n=1 Tax=Sporisorium reilianum f. sp. reilianum TaxID=72559 RepID=A0A2N8U6W4_9BASI|nr:related to TAF1-TFIID subunit (TBP-associated factor), 145 kD [Sporisorium reilianum f. sp. reilianum]
MEDEQNAALHLGGLALGNVLRDLGIDEHSDLERLGIASGSGRIKQEDIYNDRFADDDDDLGDAYRRNGSSTKDWETEVDDEMRRELASERDSEERAELDRYYRQGLAQLEQPRAPLRGEDDDFDEDDSDDEDDVPLSQQPPQQSQTNGHATHTNGHARFGEGVIRVKEERDDDSDMAFLSGPVPSSSTAPQSASTPLVLPTSRSQRQDSPQTPPPSPHQHQPYMSSAQPPRPYVDMDEVRHHFPDFEPGKILNFTDLFATRPPKKRKLGSTAAKFHITPEDELPIPMSTREELLRSSTLRPQHASILPTLTRDLDRASTAAGQDDAAVDEIDLAVISTPGVKAEKRNAALAPVELDDWEDRIVWETFHQNQSSALTPMQAEQTDMQPSAAYAPAPPVVDKPFNHDLFCGAWTRSIIWDTRSPFEPFDKLVLDMNDPQMMLEEDLGPKTKQNSLLRSDAPVVSAAAQRDLARRQAELDPLNLSNDKFYEQTREHRQRVRQTLGKLVVQHAWPAIKLQLPWYKTKLTKAEARSFHRPAMQFPTNMPLHFSRTISSKKKKEGAGARKAKDPNEMLRTTRDLTLKDTGPYVLYEYSEEYPPLLSKIGMGSLLVNYYRKKDAKDEHVPKMDIGEPYLLDVADESPFMKFGNIERGQVQPTLYNNMIRAPLFRHKPAHTDFLLIRSTTKNEIRYYLREIRNLFVVGQTYPVQPIPGPHARLITNNIKYRLQMIAYKLIQKSQRQRIKIHRLMRYFPDQNELQMRQRLKEFMEYNRKAGDVNQGFWKLKPHIVVPEEAELLKMLPPENICLAESMQVGQRHLLDCGYTNTAEGDDDDESKMDIEQLLAPWITSKNFINATQGKAMLKLHGDGDPTGRGEAFSFIRVSMKEIFLRADEDVEERLAQAEAEAKSKSGHKYSVAEQQAVYRSEIDRIWNAQCRSLSNPVPPKVTAEDERRALLQANGGVKPDARSGGRGESVRRDRSPSAMSTVNGDGGDKSTKVLRIRRFINGKWQREMVRDPAVINAYLTQRKKIEDEAIATEDLLPTGDAAIDMARMKRLQEELAQRKKNQERRIQRKNAKAAAEGLAIPGGYKSLLNKTDTKRRCGRCGEVGHMSTNTSCPMFPKDGGKNGAGGAAGGSGGPGTPGTPAGGARPGMPHLASGGGFFGPGMGMGIGITSAGPMTPMTPAAQTPTDSPAPAQSPAPGSGTPTPGLKLKLKKKA